MKIKDFVHFKNQNKMWNIKMSLFKRHNIFIHISFVTCHLVVLVETLPLGGNCILSIVIAIYCTQRL